MHWKVIELCFMVPPHSLISENSYACYRNTVSLLEAYLQSIKPRNLMICSTESCFNVVHRILHLCFTKSWLKSQYFGVGSLHLI